LVKREFGSWMGQVFAVLRHFKFLRGTAIDPFGRTDERKQERALIGRYRDTVRELLGGLNPQNLALAVQIASLPERIRGYGHVKARNLAEVEPQWEILMRQWRQDGAAGTGADGGQARVTELA